METPDRAACLKAQTVRWLEHVSLCRSIDMPAKLWKSGGKKKKGRPKKRCRCDESESIRLEEQSEGQSQMEG